MNIQNRLKKMENQITKEDSDLCVCPDALALKATPFADVCYKCAKRIDLMTWEHWQLIHATENTNYFAFGLRRDDNHKLDDLPNDYFEPQIMEVLEAWQAAKQQMENQ